MVNLLPHEDYIVLSLAQWAMSMLGVKSELSVFALAMGYLDLYTDMDLYYIYVLSL